MRTILYRTGKTPMILKVSVGFVLGMLFGFIAAPMMPYSTILSHHIMPFLELVGKLFLRILTIIIIPLVFASLVAGIASMGDIKKLGRIGMKTIALFFITTVIAVTVGMFCADILKPGIKINVQEGLHNYFGAKKQIRELILGIIPENPVASVLHTNILYFIIFAIVFGIVLTFLGSAGEKAAAFFERMARFMQKVTQIVIGFAPFGVFALIATAAADFGLTLIAPFAVIIAAMYAGCMLQIGVYSLMIIFFCRRSPRWFLRGIRESAVTAFVTRSSSVTLPITLDNMKAMGVSEEISSFVLPLGATVNMNGTAIYQVIAALFVARAYGIPVTAPLQMSIFTAAVAASIGTVGIPSAGMIMLTMVLTSAGLPVGGVGLLAGIDVILGAARTCLNVVGDCAVCAVVSASEGDNLTENN